MAEFADKLMAGNYILSVTIGNYLIDSSGTSKAVQAHQDIFLSKEINFVVIFPISKTVGQGGRSRVVISGYYGVIINGLFCGVRTLPQILDELVCLQNKNHGCAGVLVHHLIRSRIKLVQQLIDSVQGVPVVFYLHDYYSYCVNPKLLKNDVRFCGGIANCDDCFYGKKRRKHYHEVRQLLESCKERLICVAPAEYTKQIWVTLFPDFSNQVIVIPHLKESGVYQPINLITEKTSKIRIAYVGAQTKEKGWDLWKKIVQISKKDDYDFFYFGNGTEQLEGVTNICVDVARQGKNAMVDALRQNRIQVTLLASIWPETYSYTMYESHAANCWIMTLSGSGNIASATGKENMGIVYDDENKLIEELECPQEFREMLVLWQNKGHIIPEQYCDNGEIVSQFNLADEATLKPIKSTIVSTGLAKVVDKIYRRARTD